ncbi:ROK family transcriptional regulator [Plantibacter sp. Mn2098]|uniref:ROK family transcriptional regulator n=1 Tax=Plantibacter sp. Mn2098 TaxID=3395266 RepID=UPI003BBE6172
MQRGTNLPALGGYNQAVILDLIRRSGSGLSRVELAGETGLSGQTVSNVTKRLLEDGIIHESGKSSTGPGKPRTILQLESRARVAIGVHLDPSVITYVLVDLEGAVIGHRRSLTPSPIDPVSAIATVVAAIDALTAEAGIDRERVLGVGIAAPGPIDADRGILIAPPLLVGWDRVSLRDALIEATGLPVVLEKDVTAAAVAELWLQSGPSRDNFAFLYYGTGIGIGLALEHEVLRGASRNAGDAGHIMVADDGPLCECGLHGCLGNLVQPKALVTDAIASGLFDGPEVADEAAAVIGDGSELDAARVLLGMELIAALASRGDPRAGAVLHGVASHIARALVTIVNLLDIDHVVFGGPFWSPIAAVVLAEMPELIAKHPALVQPHPVVVTDSASGDDVTAIGAACLVLDHTFSPRPAALLISATR